MARRARGLMAEILGGLALVMVAATALLGAMLAMHHDGQQRELLARALATEASAPPGAPGLVDDTAWWQVEANGAARPRDLRAGPIDADQQLRPEARRDLAERRAQHGEVISEGVRAGVARPQQHRQRLGGIGAPGTQRMESVAHLEGGCGPFLVAARGDQRRVC